MKVIFNELALFEFKDAIEFYELQRPGLGREFGEEIKKSLKRIVKYPTAHSTELGEIRKYIVHRFPYKILYTIEQSHLFVIAVAHQHRRPGYWVERTELEPE